jgi:superfamily II DNA or RNA helicase
MPDLQVNSYVRVKGRPDLGTGEVVRICEESSEYRADVAFEGPDGRRLETIPVSRLKKVPDLWERLACGDFDDPLDFALKQLAFQFPVTNSGGELSSSRTDLLPHQILLTHDVVATTRRRLLIADEVGLGKTIETGMIIRELLARNEAERVLVIAPAGLTKNWQTELAECFGLHFDILGIDFTDANPRVWETHPRVIASIDRLKQPRRKERLSQIGSWDLVVFDEAHHLSRPWSGGRASPTQNYRLADLLRGRTRDLLFLSATPHQGDLYQFWSLIQLLDDSLFDSPDAMLDHRGLLNRVMIRRIKREVTDAEGQPLFMRRQVHSQVFTMAHRERQFYEQLTDYLREGYGAAGLGEARTTSSQRAIGFVMATFQKIMASSPRAIRQALRRRLLVLLARQQMKLEEATARKVESGAAERIQTLEQEMRSLAIQIFQVPLGGAQWAEAGTHVAQLKQRLARKAAEEETAWALDGDEEGSEVVYADTEIPGEATRVRNLVRLVPDGTDRKFDTLVRAVEDLRGINPVEKIVIFTQYRETLEYLREELAKIYGAESIVTIKGGPLADKIASVEAFWEAGGAQFLISTSAGGEGINLQCAHLLFNYDLPWNPMAVEQRIGRIHRYGQQDTVQVYNLIAEDTVEERIYTLLEEKLLQIARTIGKIDPVTGQATEDFRSEILGFLGASPDYQNLYKKALVDRDYRRTENEMAEAIDCARRASEALRTLAQNLEGFNLAHYAALRGKYTLEDLRRFCLAAIPRLGGAILPDGEFYRIEVPSRLYENPKVERNYRNVTFDRKLAMRRRQAKLLGLGHPLVDALIALFQRDDMPGSIAYLAARQNCSKCLRVHCLIRAAVEDGRTRRFTRVADLHPDGAWAPVTDGQEQFMLNLLGHHAGAVSTHLLPERLPDWRAILRTATSYWESELRAQQSGILSLRFLITGMALIDYDHPAALG